MVSQDRSNSMAPMRGGSGATSSAPATLVKPHRAIEQPAQFESKNVGERASPSVASKVTFPARAFWSWRAPWSAFPVRRGR